MRNFNLSLFGWKNAAVVILAAASTVFWIVTIAMRGFSAANLLAILVAAAALAACLTNAAREYRKNRK